MCMKSVLALSVLSASTLLSGLVHADSESNFLVGLEGGYARMKTNFITGYLAPTVAPLPILTSIDNETYMISDQSLFLGLLAGWQWRCNRMMWGIEGNADFSTLAKAKPFMYSVFSSNVPGPIDVFSATALYERGPVFALTGRLGYFVTSGFMPYVRLGAQVSRDEASYQVFAGSNQLSDFISSGKQDIWGGVGGVGVELPALVGPSTVRVEYTFSRTESIVIEDGAAPIFGSDKFRNPQTNAIKFAWVWNFL